MFKLNAKCDADLLLYSLGHFECDGNTVHMFTQWCWPPTLTSTVKSSLFTYEHSSPLSLAARLHWCCANHSHYLNNGWTLSGHTSYVFNSTHQEVELLGHTVIIHLMFWGTAKLYSKESASFYNLNNKFESFNFSTSPTIIFCLFNINILLGVSILLLIYFSLIINYVEHISMCLLIMCLSLKKYLFKLLAHLKKWLFDL